MRTRQANDRRFEAAGTFDSPDETLLSIFSRRRDSYLRLWGCRAASPLDENAFWGRRTLPL